MKNFKLPQKIATGNKRNFATTTKYCANRDESDRLIKNRALFEHNPEMKTSSHLANETSQSSEQLFDLLKKNKQECSDNCFSADLSMREAEEICSKASSLFSRNKSSLTDAQRKEVESNINLSAVPNSHPNHETEEEKSIFYIDRYLKRLVGAIYRAKAVQEVLPNPDATNVVVTKSESLITELNTLSHNIETLTNNNDKIREELRSRNVSLTEDYLTTFMDIPGDISDNVD